MRRRHTITEQRMINDRGFDRDPEAVYRITHDRMIRWAFERPELKLSGHESTSQTYKLMRHGDMMPSNITRSRKPITVRGKESNSYKPQGITRADVQADRYRTTRAIESIVDAMPKEHRALIALRYIEGVDSKSEIERRTGIDRRGFGAALMLILSQIDWQLNLKSFGGERLQKSA